MVKEVEHKGKKYFMCEACDMYYLDSATAQKCEDFCNKFKSCDLEIMKHAVNLKDVGDCGC
jgi:hypothetical protein